MKVQVKSVCREATYLLQLLKCGRCVPKVAYDVALVHVCILLWYRLSVTNWNIKRLAQVQLLIGPNLETHDVIVSS